MAVNTLLHMLRPSVQDAGWLLCSQASANTLRIIATMMKLSKNLWHTKLRTLVAYTPVGSTPGRRGFTLVSFRIYSTYCLSSLVRMAPPAFPCSSSSFRSSRKLSTITETRRFSVKNDPTTTNDENNIENQCEEMMVDNRLQCECEHDGSWKKIKSSYVVLTNL